MPLLFLHYRSEQCPDSSRRGIHIYINLLLHNLRIRNNNYLTPYLEVQNVPLVENHGRKLWENSFDLLNNRLKVMIWRSNRTTASTKAKMRGWCPNTRHSLLHDLSSCLAKPQIGIETRYKHTWRVKIVQATSKMFVPMIWTKVLLGCTRTEAVIIIV